MRGQGLQLLACLVHPAQHDSLNREACYFLPQAEVRMGIE